jgi:hypothetical protein
MYGAKGAAFTLSLGQRPRIHETPKSPTLKARFTFDASSIIIGEHVKKTLVKSRCRALLRLAPAYGERTKVRDIRKSFPKQALTVRMNRCGSRSIAAKEGDSA